METNEFTRLVHEQGGRIFNTVYSMLGNRADAEDVVQDVFLRAYQSRGGFRGAASATTWLYRIAMNAVSDHMRRNGRAARLCNTLTAADLELLGAAMKTTETPESIYCRKELGETIRKALGALPPKLRMVFVLKEMDGYTYREIGRMLGISIGTVESRLFRAREMLRRDIITTTGRPGDDDDGL